MGEMRCLHPESTARGPGERLSFARGSFLAPDARAFAEQRHLVVPGLWLASSFASPERRALHFLGRHYTVCAEIFSEDIATATFSVRGPELTVEVLTRDGDYFVVAGRRRKLAWVLRDVGLTPAGAQR